MDASQLDSPPWWVTAIILLVFYAGCNYVCNSTAGSSGPKEAVVDEIDAFVASQTFITKQLKAPSTAKFARSWSDGVHIEEIGDRWVVRAYVDAQNSFGAMIRTHYRCEMEYLGEKRWRSHGCSSVN